MRPSVRPFAALAPLLLATQAFAQPTPGPEAVTGASAVPPAPAGAVVVVTPQPLTPMQPVAPGQVAPGAPQNEPWSNVSHINGQLVKVGERSDYLYDTGKTTNLATNPIGWIFGFYGASVSHAVHPNIVIRGDVNIFRFESSHGHEIGVSLPIYLRRAFQGPFLEAGVIARNMHDGCSDCSGESVGPSVVFGWQWSFDSGLNVAMALGAMRVLEDKSSHDVEPSGYFRIGYLL
ncbi:MAG TPA: hypothetical protein VFK02_23220 [Kofleriaceae bacterium]|nr:hypothetical protein [Kofleriaceae bacterium]